MTLAWSLVRVSLWSAIALFLAAGLFGMLEDRLGLSDDPRWIAYSIGWLLAFGGLIGGVAARIVAAARKAPSRFPVALTVVTFVLGVLVLGVLVVTRLGPMGVV